eukprot:3231556-Rhodomonas_salina.1
MPNPSLLQTTVSLALLNALLRRGTRVCTAGEGGARGRVPPPSRVLLPRLLLSPPLRRSRAAQP